MPGKREWILDDETWNLIEHHGAHRDFFAGTKGLFLLYAEIFMGSTIEVCKIWHTPNHCRLRAVRGFAWRRWSDNGIDAKIAYTDSVAGLASTPPYLKKCRKFPDACVN